MLQDLNALTPAELAEALLTEWEARNQPASSAGYSASRSRFLAQFHLLSQQVLLSGDLSVDAEDVRTVLFRANGLQIGSAGRSGPDRAFRAAAAAMEACQQGALGPVSAGPANAVLLSIISAPSAGIHMDELTTITEYLQTHVGQAVEVLFGHGVRHHLAEEVQVSVLIGYGSSSAPTPALAPRPALPPEEVFPAAVRLIAEHQKVSVGFLQRHLGTGYHRTCRLLEELEAAGVIRRQAGDGYEVARKK
ncbi:DNA translocase FtsK [Hymenobacter algoricola]|uniref:FtsK gamma domain-containing protein n=1 Tax=Hymenobacter algoricola TaxID=486267 RepID=A0ABP7MPU6_9BACT